MPDALRVASDGRDQAFALAARMTREVAVSAGRLVQLLERSPMPPNSPRAQGEAFLAAMFDAHAAESPQPLAETHPLDRLAAYLSLTRLEVDVIVLAGMADENEGSPSGPPRLKPRGEPD